MERPTPARPRVGAAAALAFALLAGGACTEPEPDPTSVEVTGPEFRLAIGATFKMTAAVASADGPIPTARVTWTSRDTTSVTVRADGTASALRPGESWIVGQAGTVTDSVLVEVEFSVTQGAGRARVRIAGRETTLDMGEPYAYQSDYLGLDVSEWYFEGFDADQDTFVVAYFPTAPTGQRAALAEFSPADTALASTSAPIAFLEMYPSGNTIKVVPLRGSVDAAIVQNVPAGLREGRMRMRLTGTGRAWVGTFRTTGALTWEQTTEAFDVVADALPPFYHDMVGLSSGQLSGTAPQGTWRNTPAFWVRTIAQGRSWALLTSGPPLIRLYSPGTESVDLGTAAETTRAYGLLTDSVRGYAGTATSGRLEIARYTAPPASDLYGEIRGRATFSGTGGTQGITTVPFNGTIDFAAPVITLGTQAPAAADARARLQGRPWLARRAARLRQR